MYQLHIAGLLTIRWICNSLAAHFSYIISNYYVLYLSFSFLMMAGRCDDELRQR
jgi:hypothetical protein